MKSEMCGAFTWKKDGRIPALTSSNIFNTTLLLKGLLCYSIDDTQASALRSRTEKRTWNPNASPSQKVVQNKSSSHVRAPTSDSILSPSIRNTSTITTASRSIALALAVSASIGKERWMDEKSVSFRNVHISPLFLRAVVTKRPKLVWQMAVEWLI